MATQFNSGIEEKDFSFTATHGSVFEKRDTTLYIINKLNYYVFQGQLSFNKNTKITGIEENSIQDGTAYEEFNDIIAAFQTETATSNSRGIMASDKISRIILDTYNNDWRLFRKAIKDFLVLYRESTDIVECCYKFYYDSNEGVIYNIM